MDLKLRGADIEISKHFMFTVNATGFGADLIVIEFQNISCLRLIYLQGYADEKFRNFKTFHVYG